MRGIGCDIVDISRIEKVMQNPRFIEKVYTPYEQAYIKNKSVHTAAGIWAAKESVGKALGTGFLGFTTKDVEIRHDKSGKPYAVLHNDAEKLYAELCIEHIYISISHEQKYALAFAIAE